MKIDPKASAATSFFMVLAIIVMLALAWSVYQDGNETAGDAPAVPAETAD